MKVCPTCQTQLSDHARFCIKCGQSLVAGSTKPGWTCVRCGHSNPEQATTCTACSWGKPLRAAEKKKSAPIVFDEQWTCPSCGTKNHQHKIYCISCGWSDGIRKEIKGVFLICIFLLACFGWMIYKTSLWSDGSILLDYYHCRSEVLVTYLQEELHLFGLMPIMTVLNLVGIVACLLGIYHSLNQRESSPAFVRVAAGSAFALEVLDFVAMQFMSASMSQAISRASNGDSRLWGYGNPELLGGLDPTFTTSLIVMAVTGIIGLVISFRLIRKGA